MFKYVGFGDIIIYIGAGGIYISSLPKIQTSNMLVQYIDNNQYIYNIG